MTETATARRIVAVGELDLVSPGRRDYFVALEHDSIWGSHLIPLTVIVGPQAEDGKGLVVFGANHGNEYEGPIIIRHLLAEVDAPRVRGRLILVPVLNPAAFRSGTRDSIGDDGANLNRAFVPAAGQPPLGTITYRVADFVRRVIWPHVHAVIDLHAGGDVARFALCTSFHDVADTEQALAMQAVARLFGTPLVIAYQNETPGLLTSEAERLGKITIGTELGWGGAVSAQGVRYGKHGVLAAAITLGQMSGTVEPIGHQRDGTQQMVAMIDPACFTLAPVSGHYEPLLECGATVAVGDPIGLVHDFERIDTPPWPALAGTDGVVIAQAWGAHVRQGQQVVVVGRKRPWVGA
ncbi:MULTISPECIES: succinylglutamate desuccinylase/aspartoacylase family protein [unclassified Roseitalea]|uniref:succinylglutamate desuccinylase/aspartoacylase domain-containing protein n=1 Tax=unclassified Roseitalea TaxID=2639107 RepID=UPI0027402E7A|nr:MULTISPECIES: succinylglutamate desuccinylase/aspartoacylase family protein [unclassified Roseitalea]